MTAGEPVTSQQTAMRWILRMEEFLPYPQQRVWRALTDSALLACWLMPNDLMLEAGHRFAIVSDPIRQCGLGGTGHCEVLAFDEGTMLTIAWKAASENMSGLDSAVTFSVVPERAGTRLLIDHDGLHPCPYVIGRTACGPRGGRTSARRIGEVSATIGAWQACTRRLSAALAAEVGDREG